MEAFFTDETYRVSNRRPLPSYHILWLLPRSFTVLKSIRISLLFFFSRAMNSSSLMQCYYALYCGHRYLGGSLYPKCLIIYCLYKENPFLRGMLVCGFNRSPPSSQYNIYSSLFFKDLKNIVLQMPILHDMFYVMVT